MLGILGSLAGQFVPGIDRPVSASQMLGLQAAAVPHCFYVGSGDLSSNPHPSLVSALPLESLKCEISLSLELQFGL